MEESSGEVSSRSPSALTVMCGWATAEAASAAPGRPPGGYELAREHDKLHWPVPGQAVAGLSASTVTCILFSSISRWQ